MRVTDVSMQKPRHRKVSGFLFSDGRRTGRTAVIDVCGCCGRCFGRSREDQRALKALTLANSLASLRSAGV